MFQAFQYIVLRILYNTKCWSLLFHLSKYASFYDRCIIPVPYDTIATSVSTHSPSPTSKYICYLLWVSKAVITKHNKQEAKMIDIYSFPTLEAETRKIDCLQSMEFLSAPLGSDSSYILQVLVVSSDAYHINPIYLFSCILPVLDCRVLHSLRS